jgi:transposase
MEYFAGIDVSLEQSSVCVVEGAGKIVRETKVTSEPEALVRFFGVLEIGVTRIGLEAGPLSQWLHAGLVAAGFEVVLLETRHVKAALSAMVNKTDRKDARGIAQLLRMGWFLPGHAMLELITEPMLRAREVLRTEYARLHGEILAIAKPDPVCRRLMTAPGVGAVVAITFKSAVDDPGRFIRSRALGAYFGLTPKKYQSGERDVTGAISRVGDAMVRATLYEAANVMLSRVTRFSSLKRWALDVAKRRGLKRAKVALARKLATVLHRMWIDGTTFHWGKQAVVAV